MIRRHRSRMLPGGIGYQDNPTFGGFNPKSPCSDHAMELGDLEAAFVGNLARYCMAMGSIPSKPIRGFWWVNGVCRGLRGGLDEDEFNFAGEHTGHNYLGDVQRVVNHLVAHAKEIINTEGVEVILKAGQETRWYGLKMFPNEEIEWESQEEVIQRTGCDRTTLWRWRKSGAIEYLKDHAGIFYKSSDIDLMMEIKRGNMLRGYRK